MSSSPLTSRAHTIADRAAALGFAQTGFSAPTPSPNLPHFIQWLARGSHGSMDYLAKNPEFRANPASLLENVKTIICVADRYPFEPTTPQEPVPVDQNIAATGKIARYAWGDDYHKSLKDRLHTLADDLRLLFPDHAFLTTVDSAPIFERDQAARAGLGWIGKHTLLIHPKTGSWMVLGEILTTLPIQTAQAANLLISDHCGSCTRCIDACPTQCITPYSVNASRCISYLTIEHKGPIPQDLHRPMGPWLAGCDICQEVCPYNAKQAGQQGGIAQVRSPSGDTRLAKRYSGHTAPYHNQTPYHPGHATRAPGPSVSLLRILRWTPADREQMLQRSALKRIKLDEFKRNAIIASQNFILDNPHHLQSPQLLHEITQLSQSQDVSTTLRDTARAALLAIGTNSSLTTPLPPTP
jgi:epoxyqueuosine reductase